MAPINISINIASMIKSVIHLNVKELYHMEIKQYKKQFISMALCCGLSYASTDEYISEKQIDRFATALTQIQHYYLKPTEYQTLFDNAIRGMLTGLDPHSDYLSPQDIEELQTSTTGEYAGIGIEIIPDNGLIKVISPFDDTPAFKAGLEPGDIILKIDDKFIKDISTDEAVSLMKGKPGSHLTLTIMRQGKADPLDFDLIREVISLKTVKSTLYPNNIGYVKISVFNDITTEETKKQIEEMQENTPLKGLIVDLRNNPGGTLESAISTTDLFLDSKNTKYNNMIVYTKGRTELDNIDAYATPNDIMNRKPIIVLINSGSASASEIFAGALQDNNRGIVFGTKSFGKGSVQSIIPIDYESAIKLTTALYYTPSGRSIQATGIVPDVYAPYTKMPKQDQNINLNLYENNLSGHLLNNTNKQSDSNDNIAQNATEKHLELAKQDFQLYQAINLIKGIISSNV